MSDRDTLPRCRNPAHSGISPRPRQDRATVHRRMAYVRAAHRFIRRAWTQPVTKREDRIRWRRRADLRSIRPPRSQFRRSATARRSRSWLCCAPHEAVMTLPHDRAGVCQQRKRMKRSGSLPRESSHRAHPISGHRVATIRGGCDRVWCQGKPAMPRSSDDALSTGNNVVRRHHS